jgi:hypothetical protein
LGLRGAPAGALFRFSRLPRLPFPDLVVSTDKRLCGALNSNLLREAAKFEKDTTSYLTAGKKAAQSVARKRRQTVPVCGHRARVQGDP